MQEDHVRTVRHHAAGRQRGRDEPEARRTVDGIAQRRRGELSAAVDQVLVRVDRVMDVVCERRDRLADAGAVGSVSRAAREPRDERTFHLLLQVEHGRVLVATEVGAERGHLAPRRPREQAPAPAAQRDGNHAPHAGIERDERRETLLGNPVHGEPGTLLVHVGDERQRVDDVPKRRGPHDEDRGHGAAPAYGTRGQRSGENP